MAENKTLADVIKVLRDQGQLTRNSGTNSIKSVKEILMGGDEELSNTISDLVDEFKQNRLDAEEERRERKPGSSVPPQKEPESAKEDFGFGSFGIAGVLTAIAGSAVGALTGLLEGAAKFFRPITRFFTENPIVRSVKKMFDSIKNAESGFRKGINDKVIKPIKDFGGRIAKVFEPITQFFQGGGDDAFKRLRQLKTIFGGFFDVFRNVFSKLFAPIQIIIGVIEGITGAFKGFERQEGQGIIAQILGAVTGALSGIAAGIVGGFLDLAKSAISWIAGAFGFDKVEESLDSFSFSDMIIDGFNRITDGIVKLFKDPGKFIEDLQFDVFISQVKKDLTAFVSSIPQKVSSFISGMGTRVSGIFSEIDFGAMGQRLKESFIAITSLPFTLAQKAVASLIRLITGEEEVASQVEEFPIKKMITGALESLYNILTAPIRVIENLFNGESPIEDLSGVTFDISNKLKEFVLSQLPDPDSLIARTVIPDAVYEWANSPTPPSVPPPAAEEPAGSTPVAAPTPIGMDEIPTAPAPAAEPPEVIKAQRARLETKADRLKKQLSEDPENEDLKGEFRALVSEMRRLRDPGLVTRKIEREERGLMTRPSLDLPPLSAAEFQTANMNQVQRENKEATAASTTAVNFAPVNQNTTNVNNNSTTAAIMTPNMPTVDNLDRSWGN